jgi:hypothetical protein
MSLRSSSLRSDITIKLKDQCGCSYEKVYQFNHVCILRVISIETIKHWFFRDQIEHYFLLYHIADLLCTCLLNPNHNYYSKIILLEKEFNVDLEGLDLIIDDYREWYVPS